MVFDITQLNKIRKQLNLTQNKFAKESGISQSMVAKIEAGKLDPTYSYVKKIEEAIERLTKHEEETAKDIMNKKAISVNKTSKLYDIIKVLTHNEISQVLVVSGKEVIGLVTESDIIQHPENIQHETAEEIMREAPPTIAENAKMSVIMSLLRFYPIIVIKKNGNLVGVITKADVIKNLK